MSYTSRQLPRSYIQHHVRLQWKLFNGRECNFSTRREPISVRLFSTITFSRQDTTKHEPAWRAAKAVQREPRLPYATSSSYRAAPPLDTEPCNEIRQLGVTLWKPRVLTSPAFSSPFIPFAIHSKFYRLRFLSSAFVSVAKQSGTTPKRLIRH